MAAEGMLVVLPQNNNDFFCHTCDIHIKIRNPSDFTCPRCKLGFIEELEETADNTGLHDNFSDNIRRLLDRFPNRYTRNSTSPYYRIANEILTPIISGAASGSGTSGINSRRRTARTAALDSIIQEITVSVGGGSDGSIARSMIVMGNPRDYAWGREGLEAVMSQLLNQFEYTGPPPLTKDQMNDISKESITTEQVDAKLQCAICFDDFQLEEIVRKLDCSHYYHEQCIFPWVKQHATCPVCRKNLNSEHETTENVSSEDSIMAAIRAAAEGRELSLRHAVNALNRGQTATMPDLIPNAEDAGNVNSGFAGQRRSRRLAMLDSDSDSNSIGSRSFPYATSSSSSSVVYDNETPSEDIMNVSDISNPDSLAPRRSRLRAIPAGITTVGSGRRQTGPLFTLDLAQHQDMAPVYIPNVMPADAAFEEAYSNMVRENFFAQRIARNHPSRLEADTDNDSIDSIESITCPITSSSSSSSGVSVNDNPSDDVMIVSDISSPDEPQRSENNEECSQPSQKKSKSH